MTTTIDYPTKQLIPCCYINGSSSSKIVRISEPFKPHLEKVVFPGTKFYFQAPPDAFLEVNSGDVISSILEDRIVCNELKLDSN